jgi:radical SAM-linked protein
MLRYRAVYEKAGKARYLSHIDLIQVLERAFRRAGVAVRHTQGYHPKPDFSYGPALPLGMEGTSEVLEFKSRYLMEKEEFLARINRALPHGIRFRDILCLSSSDPSLSRSMKALIYSLEWEEQASLSPDTLEKRLEAYRRDHAEVRFDYCLEGRRLVLTIPLSSPKIPRVQDIVGETFGYEHPAFHLRRDAVVLN